MHHSLLDMVQVVFKNYRKFRIFSKVVYLLMNIYFVPEVGTDSNDDEGKFPHVWAVTSQIALTPSHTVRGGDTWESKEAFCSS